MVYHNPVFINGYPAPCPYNGEDIVYSGDKPEAPHWGIDYYLTPNFDFDNTRMVPPFRAVFNGFKCLMCGIVV